MESSHLSEMNNQRKPPHQCLSRCSGLSRFPVTHNHRKCSDQYSSHCPGLSRSPSNYNYEKHKNKCLPHCPEWYMLRKICSDTVSKPSYSCQTKHRMHRWNNCCCLCRPIYRSEMCSYRKHTSQCSLHCPESSRLSEMSNTQKRNHQCSLRCSGSSRSPEMCMY